MGHRNSEASRRRTETPVPFIDSSFPDFDTSALLALIDPINEETPGFS